MFLLSIEVHVEMGVSSLHQVNLGQNTDCSCSLRVDLSCKFESIRVGKICVGSGNSQNDGIGLSNVLDNHILDLPLNILGLVSDR